MLDLAARPRLLFFVRFAFWAALAFALFMALDPHPPQIGPPQMWDKWHHISAFATLSLLGALAYPKVPLIQLGEHLSFTGALIEVLQAIPVLHRDCDIWDWVADTIAIAIMLFLIKWVRKASHSGS